MVKGIFSDSSYYYSDPTFLWNKSEDTNKKKSYFVSFRSYKKKTNKQTDKQMCQ